MERVTNVISKKIFRLVQGKTVNKKVWELPEGTQYWHELVNIIIRLLKTRFTQTFVALLPNEH